MIWRNSAAQVAVIEWAEDDGIAEVIGDELAGLGHRPTLIRSDSLIPPGTDVVFTFGPYGKLLDFLCQLEDIPAPERPVSVHWNTEGIPDPRLPWPIIRWLAHYRSLGGSLLAPGDFPLAQGLSAKRPLSLLEMRMMRFRYLGDLYRAFRRGWIQVLADSSLIYARLRNEHGLPTLFVPWGATRRWYDDLKLERDIDVLWLGKRATQRRSRLLDQIRAQLAAHGVQMYVADNEENPFIFGETRTEMLNRAKITLNLMRTWYDDNFSRFTLAAPNRSLVVSEPLLSHCPYFEPATHYVATTTEALADAILYYLNHEEERQRIVDNAYELVTRKLTLGNGMRAIMEAVEAI